MYPESIINAYENMIIIEGSIGIIKNAGKIISFNSKIHNIRKKNNLDYDVASRHPLSLEWKKWTQRKHTNRLAQFFKYKNKFD